MLVDWHLRLYATDVVEMEKEQLDMIQDGLWLIEQALKERVEGPLSTPRLGLPVRE